jgi:Zn-dependent protease with chaperone function
MKPRLAAARLLLAGVVCLAPLVEPVAAQSPVQTPPTGFNLFTVDQDIALGRQSAVEAERQLRLLNDPAVDSYLNRMIQRLATVAPGARYPYHIKAVNAPEINAFALPGGPMYVNRGLIEAARGEAELAGVLAHEMSHVALRHGTHQASKAYLGQAGLGILGGLLGTHGGGLSQIVNAVGGVGLNVLFLKFSRDDEYQADDVGAQIMARAGYDPLLMAAFFDRLQAEQSTNPSRVAQFFSDHPASADRAARIRQLAARLGPGRAEVLGGFDNVAGRLRGSPSTPQQVVQYTEPRRVDTTYFGLPAAVRVDPPSSRFVRFRQPNGFFTVDLPDNWATYPSGFAVTMAPRGGIVSSTRDGRQVLSYGVVMSHYAPFEGEATRRSQSLERSYAPFEDRVAPRGTLEDATDDLVRTIQSVNPYLRAETGSARREEIDGAPGFSVLLSGRSPVTGEEERVTVYTRGLPDGHVFYALGVGPGRDYSSIDQTFTRMMRTLRVNDATAHRSAGANLAANNFRSRRLRAGLRPTPRPRP